jgi:hypothetical protein
VRVSTFFPGAIALIPALASAFVACNDRTSPSVVDAGPAAIGSADNTAAKAPPPLRAPHPAAPPLPDLPTLAQHQAPQAKPPPTDQSTVTLFGSCKGTWNGTELSATGCGGVTRMLGADDEGAVALVDEKTLPTQRIGLPSVVDHRADGTEGAIRNQTTAPSCTAFAAASAIDHAVARWLGKPSHVSAMEIWSRYHTPFEAKTVSSNLLQSVSTEEIWPFDAHLALLMLPCKDGAKAGTCGFAPDPKKVTAASQKPIAFFTRATKLAATDTGALEQRLASGQDIVITMDLSETFTTVGKAGARYVPHYDQAAPDSGHALLVSGYAALKSGAYFLLHNSWGPNWGDGGYAWIHEATLKAHLDEALVLDGEPLTLDGAVRPKRRRGEVTCAGDLVPDSISGACTKLCPDGSPRHEGVCAAAKDACPAGYVNLTGACARAAPSAKGRETSHGIDFQCGAGGCTYVVPKSVDPACTGSLCKASCPAPDFRLARDAAGLTCIE